MKEFIVFCPNNIRLQWFGADIVSVRREAEGAGHTVEAVRFVARLGPGGDPREIAVLTVRGPLPPTSEPVLVSWCCCGQDRPCPTHTASLRRAMPL